VTALAPDHDVSSGPARAPPYDAGLNENGGNAEHKSPATTLTSTSRTPALLTPIDECDHRSPSARSDRPLSIQHARGA
jgi:hypothetical protein